MEKLHQQYLKRGALDDIHFEQSLDKDVWSIILYHHLNDSTLVEQLICTIVTDSKASYVKCSSRLLKSTEAVLDIDSRQNIFVSGWWIYGTKHVIIGTQDCPQCLHTSAVGPDNGHEHGQSQTRKRPRQPSSKKLHKSPPEGLQTALQRLLQNEGQREPHKKTNTKRTSGHISTLAPNKKTNTKRTSGHVSTFGPTGKRQYQTVGYQILNLSEAFITGLDALFGERSKDSVNMVKQCYSSAASDTRTLLSEWNKLQPGQFAPEAFFEITEALTKSKIKEYKCVDLIGSCVSGYMQTALRSKKPDNSRDRRRHRWKIASERIVRIMSKLMHWYGSTGMIVITALSVANAPLLSIHTILEKDVDFFTDSIVSIFDIIIRQKIAEIKDNHLTIPIVNPVESIFRYTSTKRDENYFKTFNLLPFISAKTSVFSDINASDIIKDVERRCSEFSSDLTSQTTFIRLNAKKFANGLILPSLHDQVEKYSCPIIDTAYTWIKDEQSEHSTTPTDSSTTDDRIALATLSLLLGTSPMLEKIVEECNSIDDYRKFGPESDLNLSFTYLPQAHLEQELIRLPYRPDEIESNLVSPTFRTFDTTQNSHNRISSWNSNIEDDLNTCFDMPSSQCQVGGDNFGLDGLFDTSPFELFVPDLHVVDSLCP